MAGCLPAARVLVCNSKALAGTHSTRTTRRVHTRTLLQMERALEMKDAQLAVFMNTAHRQIADLEATVKELQKM